MSVVVQNLTKTFQNQRAVDNISFTVEEGEIVGFLGPNGAGKSTTMKIITSFIPPTEGKVTICGYDVNENSLEVKKCVGYLPEHNPLYLEMYVHEYLQFVAEMQGISKKESKIRIPEIIQITGLTIEQNKKIGQLSKGYRQRVGLAQALLHNPKVLILDEPTTGLDPNQILEIRKLIKDISKDKTIIFSTHIMQEVQAICDRVIIINKGKIVADNKLIDLQSVTEDQRIHIVDFESEINIELLKRISGIIEIKHLQANSYQVVSGKIDIRSAIFKVAADNNLPLVGLKKQENSLEHIFRTLTKSE